MVRIMPQGGTGDKEHFGIWDQVNQGWDKDRTGVHGSASVVDMKGILRGTAREGVGTEDEGATTLKRHARLWGLLQPRTGRM